MARSALTRRRRSAAFEPVAVALTCTVVVPTTRCLPSCSCVSANSSVDDSPTEEPGGPRISDPDAVATVLDWRAKLAAELVRSDVVMVEPVGHPLATAKPSRALRRLTSPPPRASRHPCFESAPPGVDAVVAASRVISSRIVIET